MQWRRFWIVGVGRGKLKPVTEDRIALLLGHERGSTESFKTYSKNAASPIELQPYIELLRYPEIETEPQREKTDK